MNTEIQDEGIELSAGLQEHVPCIHRQDRQRSSARHPSGRESILTRFKALPFQTERVHSFGFRPNGLIQVTF